MARAYLFVENVVVPDFRSRIRGRDLCRIVLLRPGAGRGHARLSIRFRELGRAAIESHRHHRRFGLVGKNKRLKSCTTSATVGVGRRC